MSILKEDVKWAIEQQLEYLKEIHDEVDLEKKKDSHSINRQSQSNNDDLHN